MIVACEHTRLMNKSMGLCVPTMGWPSLLHEYGYRLQAIEQKLHISASVSIKPDIIVASGKEAHALVIECKSGMNVKPEQEKRYAKLDTETIRKWTKTAPPPGRHTVSYAINGLGYDRIAAHTHLPLITFYESKLEKKGSLGSVRLDKAMRNPIDLDARSEPFEHYPYGPDDDDSVIVYHALQALAQLLRSGDIDETISSEETAGKIFRQTHQYHKVLSDETSNRIKKKIRNVIQFHLLPDKKVMRQLQKIRKGEHNMPAWSHLVNACAENVRKNSSQKRL